MALVTVSKESALAEAGISVLMSSAFHGLSGNLGLCAYTASEINSALVLQAENVGQ